MKILKKWSIFRYFSEFFEIFVNFCDSFKAFFEFFLVFQKHLRACAYHFGVPVPTSEAFVTTYGANNQTKNLLPMTTLSLSKGAR